jgi:hypothetical protein
MAFVPLSLGTRKGSPTEWRECCVGLGPAASPQHDSPETAARGHRQPRDS